MKILIAEDKYDIKFITGMKLDGIPAVGNYERIWAKNGVEAVNMSKESEVELIIMDCDMPNLDGTSAIKQIREFKNDVKIILYSSHHETTIKDLYGYVPYDFYCFKDHQTKLFSKLVSKCLEQ